MAFGRTQPIEGSGRALEPKWVEQAAAVVRVMPLVCPSGPDPSSGGGLTGILAFCRRYEARHALLQSKLGPEASDDIKNSITTSLGPEPTQPHCSN